LSFTHLASLFIHVTCSSHAEFFCSATRTNQEMYFRDAFAANKTIRITLRFPCHCMSLDQANKQHVFLNFNECIVCFTLFIVHFWFAVVVQVERNNSQSDELHKLWWGRFSQKQHFTGRAKKDSMRLCHGLNQILNCNCLRLNAWQEKTESPTLAPIVL
jgi:hypothetical protein